MTALQAAGGGLPLALHIPHVVEQAGSLAGFAAVIGLAVLSALYFSQARDLRRLREWAGRAPERAAEGGPAAAAPVPGRVVATPQRPAQATAPAPATTAQPANGAPGATPAAAPAAAATNGDAAPSVTATPAADKAAGDETDAEKTDAAKPGMPAPASAAAAASAGAAAATAGTGAVSAGGPSASAPAASPPAGAPSPAGSAPAATPAAAGPSTAPAAKPPASAPKPTSPRPPGSVLPPRTGTLPPVRRLPSSNVGAGPAQTGILGQAPEKKKRNPLYVVLAVAGVLVIGAAAAIGVPAIVNGSKNDNKASKSSSHKHTHSTKTVVASSPSKITVAVLNGTSIPGLAAQVGDRVQADGFTKGTVSNAALTQGQRANSVVMYAPGHQKDAATVAKKLSIRTVQPVDSDSRQIAG